MPDFKDHIYQAKHNIEVLEFVNTSGKYYDWQVTLCFYSALHFINAHLAQCNNSHYRTHMHDKKLLRSRKKKSKARNEEIKAIRQKYPELKLLDDMLKGITINESDEELLDEHYTQIAKKEGII